MEVFQMETRICHICDSRYAILNLSTQVGESLSICLKCFKDRSKTGEFPSIEELGVDFIKKVINSFPSEQTESREEKKYPAATKNKRKYKPLFVEGFGKDLTSAADMQKLDPVIGREKEVDHAVRILSRRSKNNPVLVGEPGVGKTAIVEGLAQRIVEGNVPKGLLDKRVIVLNIGNVVAGTKYRGEFEERMKKIIDEVMEEGNVILFIDEIHTMVGAGGAEGAVDASNILKPALSRGEVQVIGATTLDEYRKYIEKDAALERRFQKVMVEEPSESEAKIILRGLKAKYEAFHEIEITEEAITTAVELSKKYIADRFLPDKAIDLIDEACANKKIKNNQKSAELLLLETKLNQLLAKKEEAIYGQDFETAKATKREEERTKKQIEKAELLQSKNKEENAQILEEDIAYIVGEWTGIPVTQLTKEEKVRLKTLESDLNNYVKGQSEAIEVISRSIKRNKMGLKNPNRPAGVFLLVGPTGVGKTELAKSVAKLIYGSEDNMITFDMSEFMEKHSVSKLIGSPPGYVGYEDEGKLTKLLRRKPYSLILFDEIEKASPDVFNLLLQLFEEGRITDSKGRTIDGKNAIFLMTSNAGSEIYSQAKPGMSFIQSNEQASLKDKINKRLKDTFKPEFLNRLDDTLIFNKLPKDVMVSIANKMVEEVADQLKMQGMDVKFTAKFTEHIAEIGFSPEYGARPLRREIDKVKDLIADKMIESNEDIDKLTIGVKDGKVVLR